MVKAKDGIIYGPISEIKMILDQLDGLRELKVSAVVSAVSEADVTDVFTLRDLETIRTNPFFSEYAGKSLEEIKKTLRGKYPKKFSAEEKSGWDRAGYAAEAYEENRMLLEREEVIVFKQGGSFTIKIGDENHFINFWYHPGDGHLVFNSNNIANPMTETGYRSDVLNHLLDYGSFPEMIERRVRYNVADQHNEFIGKKEKAAKKQKAESLEILNLKYEQVELGYTEYFNSLKPENLSPPEEPTVLEKRIKAFESYGWTLFDRGNGTFSGVKKFAQNSFTTKIDGAKTWNELLNAVQDVEMKENSADLASGELTDGQIIAYPINVSDIVPSDFEPQKIRRQHFKTQEIEELAASIKSEGLLSPITVRPRGEQYEIVCGEQRFLAMQRANFEKIPCFIKDVSDKAAFDIQTNENLQRKEPDPLDLAVSYQYYIDHFGMSVDDLAVQFSKDKAFITRSLKLNDSIAEVRADYYDGFLPIGHVGVICRQSAKDQLEILNELTYHDNQKTGGAFTLADLKLNIRDEITLKLSSAHFDTEDPRLHIKNLVCSQCPERTGYKPLLFGEDYGSEDRCLNKSCFELKTSSFRKMQQIEIAENLPNPDEKPLEEIIETIPFVTERAYTTEPEIKNKVLTNQEFLEEPECAFSILSIVADGERKNEKVYVCQNEQCEIHHPVAQMSAQELEKRQTQFDKKVREILDRKVFSAAISAFNDHHPFWMFADLVSQLIKTLWDSLEGNTNERMFVCDLVRNWKGVPKNGYLNRPDFFKLVDSLDKLQQTQILFIFTMRTQRNYSDGTAAIAKSYTKLDYALIEAEAIYKLAPEEYKEKAEQYLVSIKNETPLPKPAFWTELPEGKI